MVASRKADDSSTHKGAAGVVLMWHIAKKSLQVGAIAGTFVYPLYVGVRYRKLVSLQQLSKGAGECKLWL